ncbi:GyrI-like domain-containing protein [Streptomyces sp. STCH 565 A]|uniref:GyrI-like domain-containing protein n=1 Tax=Streptomyces sp. STCH 565 A TaxID=2950532 RepID=UPI002075A2BB|nr:GyrI-like domain-containing protein [Streptomyces sp. STCH 565 A]MCM8554308.1 GyrI-like domain-containing protein [Streptomyces sp. STCH 565 A]
MNSMLSAEPQYFSAADEPETATIGAANYLSLTGDGPPGTDTFYAKKASLTHAATLLDAAGPVEILYWYGPEHGEIDIAGFYSTAPLDALLYRMLIRVPADVANAGVPDEVRTATGAYGPDLGFFSMTEGKVVQVMHHGPFAGEHETLSRLGAFADAQSLRRSGPHHEIHLDPFGPGSSQEHLRTILRDPVA